MPYKERLTILHEAEINDLYGVPSLSLEEKLFCRKHNTGQ